MLKFSKDSKKSPEVQSSLTFSLKAASRYATYTSSDDELDSEHVPSLAPLKELVITIPHADADLPPMKSSPGSPKQAPSFAERNKAQPKKRKT